MTGYWDAYKLDIHTDVIADSDDEQRAKTTIDAEESRHETHTMIGDFTEITVSNSGDDLRLVRATSARLDGRMSDVPEVEIWGTVSL